VTRGADNRTHRIVSRGLHRLAICLWITCRGSNSRRGWGGGAGRAGGRDADHTHRGGTVEVHGSRAGIGLSHPTSADQGAVDVLATGRIRVIANRISSLRLNCRTVSGCVARGWCRRRGGGGGAAGRGGCVIGIGTGRHHLVGCA